MRLAASVNHWLHLLSVIFWIGGMAFQVLIIGPFVKSDHPPPAYLVILANRFQKFISPLLFILIVTGGINLGFRRIDSGALPPDYLKAFGLKIFLVAAAISIHFFGFIRSGTEGVENQTGTELPRQGYAQWTLLLGVVIIFIASILRQWRF